MKKKSIKKKHKIIIPKHVAIIMDGNNRWTKKRKLSSFIGHEKGIDAIKRTIEIAKFYGIKYLTLYSFSAENWSRPKKEVSFLMNLLRKYLNSEANNLMKNNISVNVIGQRTRLPNDIVKKINKYENLTKNNKSLNLIFALDYGSRQEITLTFKNIIKNIINKKINLRQLNEKFISSNLFTCNFPDPDLLIRTSGEKRLSNFLLWQLAYAEFVFLDVLWPDFEKKHFINALTQFSQRKRRYGSRI